MSTKADYAITGKLSIRVDVDGYPFTDDPYVCVQLTGVSGAETDYCELLTMTEARALIRRLEIAIHGRQEGIKWGQK